jgi:hypothetical protein
MTICRCLPQDTTACLRIICQSAMHTFLKLAPSAKAARPRYQASRFGGQGGRLRGEGDEGEARERRERQGRGGGRPRGGECNARCAAPSPGAFTYVAPSPGAFTYAAPSPGAPSTVKGSRSSSPLVSTSSFTLAQAG